VLVAGPAGGLQKLFDQEIVVEFLQLYPIFDFDEANDIGIHITDDARRVIGGCVGDFRAH
jgi:hypothetical protein